jgi:ankyrin repeat protein
MGCNALVLEAQRGNLEAIVRAATNGESVDSANRYGVTPLMAAALWGRSEIARFLLNSGAEFDAKESSFGCNALIFACLSGKREVVKLILERGADPNVPDVSGRTPLMAAASVGSASVVETLLAHGADSGARNNVGVTASDLAYRNGHKKLAERLMNLDAPLSESIEKSMARALS